MQAVDASVLTQLSQAVQVVLDGTVTEQQRSAASQVCEDFKSSPLGVVLPYSAALLQTDVPACRLFALHSVEHVIKYQWQTYGASEKAMLKQSMLDLLANGTKGLDDSHAIKEKIARLVVEVAKRQWPEQWGDFIPVLSAAVVASPSQCDLTLRVLRTLAEDVMVFFADLSPGRLKALQSELVKVCPDILAFIHTQLVQYHAMLTGKASAPDLPPAAVTLLMKSLLEALAAFVDWAPAHLLNQGRFVTMAVECLAFPALRGVALETVQVAFAKKERAQVDEIKYWIQFFVNNANSMLAPTEEGFESDYAFLKLFVQAYVDLGQRQLAGLKFKKHRDLIAAYMELLLAMSDHASIMVSSYTLNFWATVLRSQDWASLRATDAYINIYYEKILMFSVSKLMKTSHPDMQRPGEAMSSNAADHSAAWYSQVDFEYADEFQGFFGSYRSKLLAIISDVARAAPDLALRVVVTHCQQVLRMNQDPGGTGREAAAKQLRYVVAGVFPKSGTSGTSSANLASLATEASMLLSAFLSTQLSDPVLVSRQLSAVAAFIPMLAYQGGELVPQVLSWTLGIATLRLPAEQSVSLSSLSEDTRSTRLKACNTVGRLCSGIGPAMLPYLDTLVQQVVSAWQQRQILAEEHGALVQASVSLACHRPPADIMTTYRICNDLVAPMITSLAEVAQNHFASPQQLLALLGVVGGSGNPDQRAVVVPSLNAVLHTLRTVSASAWKAPAPPADDTVNPLTSQLAAAVLRPVCIIIQAMDGLVAGVDTLVPAAARGILLPTVNEANSLLRLADAARAAPLDDIGRLSSWLRDVRCQCYSVIGALSSALAGVHASADFPTMLMSHVFTHLEALHNRQLRMLTSRVVLPLVLFCPPSYYSSINDILPGFIDSMNDILATRWANELNGTDTPAGTDENLELVNLRMLQEATLAFYEFLVSILWQPKTPDEVPPLLRTNERRPPLPWRTAFLDFLSQRSDILGTMCMFLARCVTWPDSTCRRGVNLFPLLLPLVLKHPDFQAFLATDMLTGVVSAFVEASDDSERADLVGVMTSIYEPLVRHGVSMQAETMLSLGATQQQIADYEAKLRGAPHNRQHRKYTKHLLEKLSGTLTGTSKPTFKQSIIIGDLSAPARSKFAKGRRKGGSNKHGGRHGGGKGGASGKQQGRNSNAKGRRGGSWADGTDDMGISGMMGSHSAPTTPIGNRTSYGMG